MRAFYSIPIILLCAVLCSSMATALPNGDTPLSNAAGEGGGGDAVTLETTTMTATANVPFTLSGRIYSKSTGAPYANIGVVLEERAPGSVAFRQIGSTTTDADGRYSFSVTRSTPGVYLYHVAVYNQVLEGDWAVTVIGSGTVPTVTTLPTVPTGGATMAQAYASYEAGNAAWSSAWAASDFGQIRMYLTQARTHFSTCLATANLVNDPANAANLALMRSVSTGYIALADAALAMYDGSDVYNAGRTQMNAGSYAAAAGSFQSAADKFQSSQSFFGQATATLQSVSFAGTSFGDGTAYIAAIIPVLNGKAAYVGEFATYARGWQHTALAYQASATGNQAGFQSEASLAMGQFGTLRSSATFGADATSNYNILATMLGGVTPAPVTTIPTTAPSTSWSFEGEWMDTSGTSFWFQAPEGNQVRGGWASGMIAGESEGSFTGTLSDGGKVLSGPFETMFQGGNFRFTLSSANTFTGYMDSPSGRVSISCTRKGAGPTPVPPTVKPTTIPTTMPITTVPTTAPSTSWSFEGGWIDTSGTYFWFQAPEGNQVRGGWEFGEIAGESEGSFTGTLSNGGKVLSGPFETMFQGGNFRFTLSSANRFTGYMDSPSGRVSISCTRM